jgi:UTP--glucose-1-phosphate uridylyltransferase
MRIRKAVFPAAGLGTRFLPATKAQPKEMLPLVDKPVIQYVIEEAVAAGIADIIIVTGRGKNAIEDHFDVSYELEKILESRGKLDLLEQVRAISNLVSVSYVRQKEALGLGHAILVAKHLIGNEPFAVLLGDDIIDSRVPCTGQMISVFEKYRSSILATQIVEGPDISRYGVIKGRPVDSDDNLNRTYLVEDLVEKPPFREAPSNLAIIGRYILTPEIFEVLEQTAADQGGEIQLTNGLRKLLAKQKIHAYRFEGKRYDAGDKLGFLKATVEFALKREDLGKEFAEYLRSLHPSL